MTKLMSAALLSESPGDPVLATDVECADPGPGQVRVRVSHCGLCHSDLTIMDGVGPGLPIILGHEAAGTVDEVGAGVSRLESGDKVMLSPFAPCGRCYFCTRGDFVLCVESSMLTGRDPDGTTPLSRGGVPILRGLGVGGFGEYTVVSETAAVRLDEDVPLEMAAVLGCAVQTGVGAVLNTAQVETGATVLVMGLGGVGAAVVQGARLAGASRVIVSDPVPERRDAAAACGATDAVDPLTADVVAESHRLTGVGVDYAFDAAGRASLIEAGMSACRPGGTTVMVGAPPLEQSVTIPHAVLFMTQEKKLVGCLYGSANSQREVPRLIGLWRSGRLDLDQMITARVPLDQIQVAIDDLRASRGIRTVISI
jgi:S-(hydroxymethyl)glutathione dehydrogenase/alcohol dehydrogenase